MIDTPGILDHPLEERNTIEMLSITALAHLRCVVLFVVDLSGTCGYTLEQQAGLFNSIKVFSACMLQYTSIVPPPPANAWQSSPFSLFLQTNRF